MYHGKSRTDLKEFVLKHNCSSSSIVGLKITVQKTYRKKRIVYMLIMN